MRNWTLAIALLFASVGYGQLEVIDSNSFNKDLLTKYVFEQVNALRKRKRLGPVGSDQILQQAANDHARYMSDNGILTHDQRMKIKRTPYDRVLMYGGSHNVVGENVQGQQLEELLLKSKYKLTYDKLAKLIVDNWKNSTQHYQNIINPEFGVMALGIQEKDGKLYLCQVFGSVPFVEKYNFQRGKAIAVNEGKECLNCKQTKKKIYNDQVSLGWYSVSNDSIYYWNTKTFPVYKHFSKKTGTYKKVKQKSNLKPLFKAKGVIAIDLLHHEQFSCDGQTSYHNAPHFDGYYLGAVDKNSIEEGDIHPNPLLYKVYVGMKPAFADTFFQVDFNLVKKEKPCMQSATIYVNPDHLKPTEYFEIPYPSVQQDKYLVVDDSVIVRIQFERGQTDQDSTIFRPLIKTLDSLVALSTENDRREIMQIYFTGVASIEGTEAANRKLIMKRGALVESYLRRYYPDISFKNEFYENFDDFRSGLAGEGYKDLVGFSDDSLRIFANEHRNDPTIEQLLDDSRFSSVRIVFREFIPIKEGSYGLSVQRIKDLMTEGNLSELVPLYQVLANRVIDGTSDQKEELLNLEIPEENQYSRLHWYRFLLDLNLENKVVTKDDLDKLRELGAISNSADFLEYRLMFNIFNRNQAIDVSDAEETLELVKSKKQKAWIESLMMIQDVMNYTKPHQAVVPQLLVNVLKKKFDFKQTYFVCQYLVEWGYAAEPYILLSKFGRRPGQLPKLYRQYIKLGFFLKQFDNEKEWKKIRVAMNILAEENPQEFCELLKWYEMGVRALTKEELANTFCKTCRD